MLGEPPTILVEEDDIDSKGKSSAFKDRTKLKCSFIYVVGAVFQLKLEFHLGNSRNKRFPCRLPRDAVVFGVFLMNLWYPGQNLDESFRFVEMEDGLKGLTLESREKKLPSISSYDNFSNLDPNSDISEKKSGVACPQTALFLSSI
ncbi:ROOT PRIMORDIUM DEFECTIVE isoform X1 [Spatholobus suberectus]|nr:ROOT PRIMORDIUM DEFECTIVE isoform X1 [Spatholobus suberectus]